MCFLLWIMVKKHVKAPSAMLAPRGVLRGAGCAGRTGAHRARARGHCLVRWTLPGGVSGARRVGKALHSGHTNKACGQALSSDVTFLKSVSDACEPHGAVTLLPADSHSRLSPRTPYIPSETVRRSPGLFALEGQAWP